MSYGNPQLCKNGCGAWIYFDKDSAVGHPSAGKWLPLEYNHDSGIRTGLIHQCLNRSKQPQKQTRTQQSQNVSNDRNSPTGQAERSQEEQDKSLEWSNLTHEQLVKKVLYEYGGEPLSVKILTARLDRIIALLESQGKAIESLLKKEMTA